MSYNFSDELISWLDKKNISRKDLIPALKQYNNAEFRGLDNITLSRWINGKTTPPLYKQFYIAKFLGIDLIDLICRYSAQSLKVTAKMSQALQSLTETLELSSLSYNQLEKEPKLTYEKQDFKTYHEIYSGFNHNIIALRDFYEELYTLGDDVTYTSACLKNSNEQIIGHFCGLRDLISLKNIGLFKNIDEEELKRSSLMNVAHFSNKKDYLDLVISTLAYYLLTAVNDKDYIYVFVPGYARYNIAKHFFNVTEVKSFLSSDKSRPNIYLLKMEVLKLICNPMLLSAIQKKLNCIKECHTRNCDHCNLRDFYKT